MTGRVGTTVRETGSIPNAIFGYTDGKILEGTSLERVNLYDFNTENQMEIGQVDVKLSVEV